MCLERIFSHHSCCRIFPPCVRFPHLRAEHSRKHMELLKLIVTETCLAKKVTLLKALRVALETSEPGDLEDVKCDRATVCSFAQSLLLSGTPKDSRDDEERQYEKTDFPGVAATACEGIICAHRFVTVTAPEFVELSDFVIPLQVLCFAHSNPELPWCSEESVAAACALSLHLKCALSVPKLLSVLKYIQPKFRKETWKKNPCYRHVYQQVLFQLSLADMAEALPVVLPPALLLVDDYMTHNQRLGLSCVRHIVVNIPPSELDQQGRLEVLFDALKHLLYVKEPDVIVELHTCLRSLLFSDYLDALRTFCIKDERRQKMADNVYYELLTAAEVEHTFSLRNAYSSQFSPYIQCLGLDVVKYMDKTLSVLLEYVEVYDTEQQTCRRNALLSLAMLIKHAWPRIQFHFRRITESLFKLAYDLDEHGRSALRAEIGECLGLLQISCPDQYQNFKADLLLLKEKDIPGVASLLASAECNRTA